MTRHLQRLGDSFSIPLHPDEDGYLGRECPACERYFKITLGTGITEGEPTCHCPYCGHREGQDHFFTKAQIKYAESVVMKKVTNAFTKDLKSLEFDIKPRGGLGIGMSMKVKSTPMHVRHYSEVELEEEIVCDNCTLRYTIYGCFAFCPDCGRHNSRQILDKNIALARQMLGIARDVGGDLADQLVSDALENGVSAFDGFGRESCRVHKSKSSHPAKAEKVSFQNLERVRQKLDDLFQVDLSIAVDAQQWDFLTRCFQKRHLLAHKMGVVDQAYLDSTNDSAAVIGRKLAITSDEVNDMLGHLIILGTFLSVELEKLP